MKFERAQDVIDTINAGQEVEVVRAENRITVNNLFNGTPPLDEEEAKAINLRINVNWGEGPVLAAHARRQYTNAFMRPGHFFRIMVPLAPPEKKTEMESFATDFINRVMKRSKEYFYLKQNQFASLVAHGIGPQMWTDRSTWLPDFIPVGDLRISTDTLTSFKNLGWFAVRYRYTPGELVRKVWGPHSDPGWNKAIVSKILDGYKEINWDTTAYTWMEAPEKMAELVKQNLSYFASDAMPVISLWHFYFMDDDKPKRTDWRMCVVPERGTVRNEPNAAEFVYKTSETQAAKLDQILQVQFGDLNNTPPFMYHSVRSLGFLLTEPCFWTNMARCRTLQHMFEMFNIWFKNVDPAGKSRATKVELFDRCFIPEGISIVPQSERHQVDPNLINMVMSQLKQLQAEASASYTQQVDTGTQREQTAYETSVKLSMVNAMMGGMLLVAFFQETFAYTEICRRFTLRKTDDPDCAKFQKAWRDRGFEMVYCNVDLWDIEPEMPLGQGNPAMEMSQASLLMQNREKYGPEAQQIILHDFTAAATSNYSKADQLVPIANIHKTSPAQKFAEADFSVLMRGLPVNILEGVNFIDQIETMLGLLAGEITNVKKAGGVASAKDINGFKMVAQHTSGLIQLLAQNKEEGPRAKQYQQVLGKLMNEVKAFEQRLAEAIKAQQEQEDQSEKAKAAAIVQGAQVKAQVTQAQAQQKMQLQEAKAATEQRRKDIQVAKDQQRKDLALAKDEFRKDVQTAKEEKRKDEESDAKIAREKKQAKVRSLQE